MMLSGYYIRQCVTNLCGISRLYPSISEAVKTIFKKATDKERAAYENQLENVEEPDPVSHNYPEYCMDKSVRDDTNNSSNSCNSCSNNNDTNNNNSSSSCNTTMTTAVIAATTTMTTAVIA